jgi:hypothetical protein
MVRPLRIDYQLRPLRIGAGRPAVGGQIRSRAGHWPWPQRGRTPAQSPGIIATAVWESHPRPEDAGQETGGLPVRVGGGGALRTFK